MTENALSIIEGKTELVFTTQNGLDPLINAVKSQVAGVIHDISTDKGRKACISLSVMVRDTKTEVDRRRMALTEDMRSKITLINTEGKRAWDALEAIQKEVRQPVTDWENKEKDRVAAHEAAIAEIQVAGTYTSGNWQSLSIEAMRDRLTEIESDTRDWQEFSVRAKETKESAILHIKSAIGTRKKHDAEQAELARLRKEEEERKQREHEEKIKQEAAEKARIEAERKAKEMADREAARVKAEQEKAEQERQRIEREKQAEKERADKADRDRIAAEEKAKQDAKAAAEKAEREKQAAIQAERNRIEAEKKRETDEIAKREADKAHKAKIHNEILAGLIPALNSAISPSDQGKAIIAAIAKGEVPHIKINY